MEFVIGPDGKLLASWDWAKPDELKKFLEKHVGPSSISDEEWKALSARPRAMTSMQNNDEVPATQVPRSSLFPLKIESKADDETEKPPLTLEAGTLPPEITPSGQSRLYLTIKPDTEKGAYFDIAEAPVILLADAKGIELKKDKAVAGKRRRAEKDIHPHSLGVMWSREKGAKDMEFTATVVAKMGKGEEPIREWTTKFRISGSIPVVSQITDEIPSNQLPPRTELKALKSALSTEEKEKPFTLEALVRRDSANSAQGTLYLLLKVNAKNGYKWNNLAAPAQVTVKPVSGAKLEKDTFNAGKREGEEDVEDRILVIKIMLDPNTEEIALDVMPRSWLCKTDEGWCREFAFTYRVTGKL